MAGSLLASTAFRRNVSKIASGCWQAKWNRGSFVAHLLCILYSDGARKSQDSGRRVSIYQIFSKSVLTNDLCSVHTWWKSVNIYATVEQFQNQAKWHNTKTLTSCDTIIPQRHNWSVHLRRHFVINCQSLAALGGCNGQRTDSFNPHPPISFSLHHLFQLQPSYLFRPSSSVQLFIIVSTNKHCQLLLQ